jgi:hypothetical protein
MGLRSERRFTSSPIGLASVRAAAKNCGSIIFISPPDGYVRKARMILMLVIAGL